MAQGEDVVPIPGTKHQKYLEQNLAAVNVRLSPAELQEIDAVLPPGQTAGDRYAPQAMAALNR
jgi:aryl-alcohol dehydrogenase-like predicted oxidoreductase